MSTGFPVCPRKRTYLPILELLPPPVLSERGQQASPKSDELGHGVFDGDGDDVGARSIEARRVLTLGGTAQPGRSSHARSSRQCRLSVFSPSHWRHGDSEHSLIRAKGIKMS